MATQENFCSLDLPCAWVSLGGWKVVEFGVLRVGNGLIIYKMPATHLIQLSAIQLQTRETKESPAQKGAKCLSFFRKLSSCLRHTSKYEDH